MARSLLIAVAIASSALPAVASDLGAVRCSPNSDRVWVYESLNSFDVETRLKCGEAVEILSRVHGFVKVRTASGLEGYVPDAAFPDLPALPDDSEKPAASLASRAVASAPGHTVAPMPPPPATTPIASSAPSTPAPSVAPVAAKVSPTNSAPAIVTQPSPAAKPVALVASKAAATPAELKAASPASSVHSTMNVKASSNAAAATPAKTHEKSSTPAAVAEPAPPRKTPAKTPAAATTQTARTFAPAPQPNASTAMVVPAKANLTAGGISMMPASANASPKSDLDLNAADRDPDLEEIPDARPENESADPACRVYFSAYGLAPAQYKWMVENRKKEFSGICPAPDLAHVDYIVLFAHDSDTFNSAMPALVHTDRNGFSDFSPMTTVDTALLSVSDLDKARYEFVWVFHSKRGTFDPARFSSRRRPLFTTDAKGSHAAGRAVEDAFQFIQGQASPDR